MQTLTGSDILILLRERYGARTWQPHHDPLSELVLTILSQNTSDKNSRPAFQALRKTFPEWSQILAAGITDIAGPIKSGGLALIKAGRIKNALFEINKKQGSLTLDFLERMQMEEAREWLLNLPGVGYKTAACVLLFALGKPALPVDTHIFRVAGRLGLIPVKTSLEQAHRSLEKSVPEKDIYEFHVLMIEHGRQTCFARRPDCKFCVCKSICPAYDKYGIITASG
jgi:endonuclease III